MRGMYLVQCLILISLFLSDVCADEITVTTTQELLDAIGSNRKILLAEGSYELAPGLSYESVSVKLASVHDGGELVISDVENLIIEGAGQEKTEIVTAATYAEVLIFRNANNITLRDLTLKHSVPGYCQSGVLTFEKSEGLDLQGVTLDGSGTTGLTLRESSKVTVDRSTISNCTQSIVEFEYARDVTLRNSEFKHNQGGFNIRASNDVTIAASEIFSNSSSFALLRLLEGSELDVKHTRIQNNQVPRLSNCEELLKISGGLIVNSGGFESRWEVLAPQILQVGTFHGDEVWGRSGEPWLGLFNTKDGWELKSTQVQVKRVHDGLFDSSAYQMSGKEVSLEGDDTPLFFVRGIEGLEEGKVQSISGVGQDAYVGNNCGASLYPGMSQRFTLGERYYVVRVTGTGELTEPVGEAQYQSMLIKDYRIQVSVREKGKTSRVDIFNADVIDDSAGAPGILWAGDLDRDGSLDLLLSTSTHYNVSAITLYLSSLSDEGLLPIATAHFSSAGC